MDRIWMMVPCHRIPERCLHIKGKPMLLCSRCFAILIGYCLLPIAVIGQIVIPIWVPIFMAIPLLIDGFTQRLKWRTSNNQIRVATGLLFGMGQSLFISTVVWSLVNQL